MLNAEIGLDVTIMNKADIANLMGALQRQMAVIESSEEVVVDTTPQETEQPGNIEEIVNEPPQLVPDAAIQDTETAPAAETAAVLPWADYADDDDEEGALDDPEETMVREVEMADLTADVETVTEQATTHLTDDEKVKLYGHANDVWPSFKVKSLNIFFEEWLPLNKQAIKDADAYDPGETGKASYATARIPTGILSRWSLAAEHYFQWVANNRSIAEIGRAHV